jgi:hypothetical protein
VIETSLIFDMVLGQSFDTMMRCTTVKPTVLVATTEPLAPNDEKAMGSDECWLRYGDCFLFGPPTQLTTTKPPRHTEAVPAGKSQARGWGCRAGVNLT